MIFAEHSQLKAQWKMTPGTLNLCYYMCDAPNTSNTLKGSKQEFIQMNHLCNILASL